jgi:deoxyribodipyrimidine photo-lyase
MPIPYPDTPIVVHLFGRDLRWRDNTALLRAADTGLPVLPVFVFDRRESGPNARQESLAYRELADMDRALREHGSGIAVGAGDTLAYLAPLLASGRVRAVFANRLHEPCAEERAADIARVCTRHGAEYREYHDATVFAPETISKPDGGAYTVYTPYARRWREAYHAASPRLAPDLLGIVRWQVGGIPAFPSAESLGIEPSAAPVPRSVPEDFDWAGYADRRDDILDPHGTSGLSVALALGTVGIRELAHAAAARSDAYLGELVWREFFHMLLSRFPASAHAEFQTRYRGIPWSRDEWHFAAWRDGATGYPLVDAAMRELVATGRMHNRLRMLSANFATRLLRLDWRLCERYFAQSLLDYDPAANIGNWQWSAGTGADAAPYFRVFNPATQFSKYDPHSEYVKKWIPEYGTHAYASPIVDYASARAEYLAWWKSVTA